MTRTTVAAAIAVLTAFAGPASAQDWPTRPVTMIVPYAAGGPVDTIGRILAARLSELLGQQVIIENAGGAGGMTGAARVAKAAPDGYTLRSEEHTSELQSLRHLVCRLLLEKKKISHHSVF